MAKQINDLSMENGNFVGDVLVTEMSVKGGDLPPGFEGVKLDVTFDFTGVDPVVVATAACGGQSLRVILQGDLRKETTAALREYEDKGYTCKVDDLINRERAAKDPQRAASNAYARMTLEQKREYLSKDLGLPDAVVEATLAKEEIEA